MHDVITAVRVNTRGTASDAGPIGEFYAKASPSGKSHRREQAAYLRVNRPNRTCGHSQEKSTKFVQFALFLSI